MDSSRHLLGFLRASRTRLTFSEKAIRLVHKTEIVPGNPPQNFIRFISDRLPFFYREAAQINRTLTEGYFFQAYRETLNKLPTDPTHRESHFGEILAGIFAEAVLELKILYSKLSLLSSENSNAYKMDLLMCDFKPDPPQLVWGEVKSSMKTPTGQPPKHDISCYASMFKSLREYTQRDFEFDLTSVKDNLDRLEENEQIRLNKVLQPYPGPGVRYMGFAVLDSATYTDEEAKTLHTRESKKDFDIDIIGLENIATCNTQTWNYLENLRRNL